MKKMLLLFLLLPILAVASFAQESRQDASISVTGIFPPFREGNAIKQTGTYGLGGLVSYRYMLTPRIAVEGNYQIAQDSQKFVANFLSTRVFARMQEFSGAIVVSPFLYKNFNPFIEAGPGAFMWSPLDTASTSSLDAKKQTLIGGVFGAGIAYEISPSFDVRAEYRGLLMKTPSFGNPQSATGVNRYYWISNPSVGIAYHF